LEHAQATESRSPPGQPTGFRHDAVFYRGERDFLSAVLPFVTAAIERAEPVLVAVIPARAQALRGRLGDRAGRVEFVDMQAAGRNPARIIPVWHDFLTRHAAGGKALNCVGEPIWTERTAEEIAECQRHEALLNLAFAGARSFALMCPYDEVGLPSDVLAAARESHPHLVRDGSLLTSPDYRGPDVIDECDRRPLSPPPGRHRRRAFAIGDLSAVRREVREWAVARGVNASRADDLALAVYETAVNSILHGGGQGVLRSWTTADTVSCEIADEGRIRDPLVGRSLASPRSERGRGLWLVNHLCDLVQIRATPVGTVVRIQQRLHEA
jgi:anti-sigma regulatory factor (Ser/Thr protein kinase)